MVEAASIPGPSQPIYTLADVINQSMVAFGQGTDYLRVNHRACRRLAALMTDTNNRHRLNEVWQDQAVQILERVRMIGRVAAAFATEEARTFINEDDVQRATLKVSLASKSGTCPDPGSVQVAGTP